MVAKAWAQVARFRLALAQKMTFCHLPKLFKCPANWLFLLRLLAVSRTIFCPAVLVTVMWPLKNTPKLSGQTVWQKDIAIKDQVHLLWKTSDIMKPCFKMFQHWSKSLFSSRSSCCSMRGWRRRSERWSKTRKRLDETTTFPSRLVRAVSIEFQKSFQLQRAILNLSFKIWQKQTSRFHTLPQKRSAWLSLGGLLPRRLHKMPTEVLSNRRAPAAWCQASSRP